MSERAMRAALLVGAALLGAAPLAAQDSAATLARMELRLDSLRRVVAVAESLSSATGPMDTIVVGSLRIATSPALAPVFRAAADRAWGKLKIQFGASLEDTGIPVLAFGVPVEPTAVEVDQDELVRAIQRAATSALWGQQDSTMMHWLGGYLPIDSMPAAEVGAILRWMAETPAIPNLPCLEGVSTACILALGLHPEADSLSAWYPPPTWPKLVALAAGTLGPAELAARPACVTEKHFASCASILARIPLTLPVPRAGRFLLTQIALDMGGPGSFNKLTADGGATISDRLAAAAGVPFDTLVTAWVGAVRSAPSGSPAPGGLELLVVLAWMSPILLLSLRGSRCR